MMNVITSNQNLFTCSTQVTQPTADAVLYDQNGIALMWDATAKWFKWIPTTGVDYNTGYLTCTSNMVASLSEYSIPVRKRDQASGNPVWLNSDPTVAPTSILGTDSIATIKTSIKFLTPALVGECDLWATIKVNINASTGSASSCTADSFITSQVYFVKW